MFFAQSVTPTPSFSPRCPSCLLYHYPIPIQHIFHIIIYCCDTTLGFLVLNTGCTPRRPHHQNLHAGRAQYPLGDAAVHPSADAGAAMRSNHDQINAMLLGILGDVTAEDRILSWHSASSHFFIPRTLLIPLSLGRVRPMPCPPPFR